MLLDRKLTIEQRTGTKNDIGEIDYSFQQVAEIPAQLLGYESESDEDEIESKREVSKDETEFLIRYKSWLNPRDYRVKYEGKTFDIQSVEEDPGKFRRKFQKVKVLYNG